MNVQADIAIHSASTKINKRITEFICKSITRPNMSHLRRKKKGDRLYEVQNYLWSFGLINKSIITKFNLILIGFFLCK